MKRTTIMIERDLLYELQQLAYQQDVSTAQMIREALAMYVTEQQKKLPGTNPLLALAGLGASAQETDVADGWDELMLQAGIDPIAGWSSRHESDH
ncbi:MAG: ribbon-helix-helix protein, CopG family [Anaerolineae bacterium]|nr:ribbon-helix-helix protein, CopG family [Anaerolineae bacterium]